MKHQENQQNSACCLVNLKFVMTMTDKIFGEP
jgi:hypothetical protein